MTNIEDYDDRPWDRVAVGDRILCPFSGREEVVTRSQHAAQGRQFVGTTAHNHHRPRKEIVQVRREVTKSDPPPVGRLPHLRGFT